MKTCSVCKNEKVLSDFGKDARKPDGHKYACKDCHNAANTRLRRVNPEKYRKTNLAYARSERGREIQRKNSLRRKFWPHLTNDEAVAEYDRLLALQNNCCAICGKHQSLMTKAFDVDHCHDSKRVRGLLCHRCNYTVVRDITYELAMTLSKYLDPARCD